MKTSNPSLLSRNEILVLVFRKFPKQDKAKLLIIATAMIFLSLLDLIGVALLGHTPSRPTTHTTQRAYPAGGVSRSSVVRASQARYY